ncbi:MAG: BON domain-containing protein [Burkholderiaceae bacterium]|nr:BON domain-containing protein [Burkholderiaceae bacterium]
MQGSRADQSGWPRETRPNRDAHEFERDSRRDRRAPMHDPRTGEPVAQRHAHTLSADAPVHAEPFRDERWNRELDTRFTGRGYHYPGGARYADPSGRRDARTRARFEETRSWDPEDRDDLWRRGEYGSRLYGNVVGAATPSGTADISRYVRPGPARRGPRGYVRSDERLHDDICERLGDERWIDLSGVDVYVEDGNVRLEGEVPDRFSKFAIEDIAAGAWGVKDVDNRIRVRTA